MDEMKLRSLSCMCNNNIIIIKFRQRHQHHKQVRGFIKTCVRVSCYKMGACACACVCIRERERESRLYPSTTIFAEKLRGNLVKVFVNGFRSSCRRRNRARRQRSFLRMADSPLLPRFLQVLHPLQPSVPLSPVGEKGNQTTTAQGQKNSQNRRSRMKILALENA